jgi:molybdopterin-synthase adenylyltransferase
MMKVTQSRITFPAHVFSEVKQYLLQGDNEEVALLFAHQAITGCTAGLFISRWVPVPPKALLIHQQDQFAVDSDFVVRHVKEARSREESLLLAHSHPGAYSIPHFSNADTRGEANLYALLQLRLPGRIHGAVVFAPGGVCARLIYPDQTVNAVKVRVIGRHAQTFHTAQEATSSTSSSIHSRQELIWGSQGQNLLRNATVGIIGAGGTGSVVAQQLIHLGVGNLIIIDPEIVILSNLSRIVGAYLSDVGHTMKVDVIARLAQNVNPEVHVHAIPETVCNASVLRELVGADLLFLCTDGHYSRAVINALGIQYLIPVVDLGFRIEMNKTKDRVASAVGEVRIVVPGGYCLCCAGVLDADRILAEKTNPQERAAFPGYFINLDVPDPSVITLNSMIGSLAVTIGLDILIPTMRSTSELDSYRFNALKGLTKHEPKAKNPTCGVCGSNGLYGLADDHPLPCA